MKRVLIAFILVCLPALTSADESGCDCCCAHCGCHAHCQKVCRAVCEMKEVKVVCYCCKQVDVGLPGPSKACGQICETNPCCQTLPADCNCSQPTAHNCWLDHWFGYGCTTKRTQWQPCDSCESRTVNKLMKYEVTQKVPTYKWVVEYCCESCCREMQPAERLSPIAPPPVGATANVAGVNSEGPPPPTDAESPTRAGSPLNVNSNQDSEKPTSRFSTPGQKLFH